MAPSRGGGELRPGLVSVGQNSAAPSPEMEAEAVAAVRPQICGVFGNEKKGPIMDDDLSAKSHHCSRFCVILYQESVVFFLFVCC